MAVRAAEALVELLPEQSSEIESRLRTFRQDIHALDDSIRGDLSDRRGGTFLAQHAAWGYFARAYDLESDRDPLTRSR